MRIQGFGFLRVEKEEEGVGGGKMKTAAAEWEN